MNSKFITTILLTSAIFFGNTAQILAAAPLPDVSVGYVVQGTVTLSKKGKGELPDDLYDIYLGNDSSVSTDKVINVAGAYVPGYTFVRVYEIFGDTDKKYYFDIPVPPEAFFSTKKKGTFKRSNTLITAYHTTEQELLNNGLDDDTNNSIHRIYKKNYIKPPKPKNPIKKFKKKLHKIAVNKFKSGLTQSITEFGAMMSVPKVVAKKTSPASGVITGKFDRDRSPAVGRFTLNFDTDLFLILQAYWKKKKNPPLIDVSSKIDII